MGDKKGLVIGLVVAASVLISGALLWQMSRSKAAPEAPAAAPAGGEAAAAKERPYSARKKGRRAGRAP